MLEAVFISDLHLHPEIPVITQRFQALLEWALTHTRRLYILGDFFHVWPGDDGMDDWSVAIAKLLKDKVDEGLTLYYMHGNRDFLLGKQFARQSGITLIKDGTVITLGKERVLLSHGDRYCTLDKAHQRFRRLTRNPLFIKTFLRTPYAWRAKIVNKVRQQSRKKTSMDQAIMDVVDQALLRHMARHRVHVLIHGHTHKPGVKQLEFKHKKYLQYVLSDWDDIPLILCYDNSKGFKFEQPIGF